MKRTDDIHAKYELWARQPRVQPLPYAVRIPGLTHITFQSYEAMNRWKQEQRLRLATLPPEQWQIKLMAENGIPIRCAGLDDLLTAKRAVNRPQDQQDIEFLKQRCHRP